MEKLDYTPFNIFSPPPSPKRRLVEAALPPPSKRHKLMLEPAVLLMGLGASVAHEPPIDILEKLVRTLGLSSSPILKTSIEDAPHPETKPPCDCFTARLTLSIGRAEVYNLAIPASALPNVKCPFHSSKPTMEDIEQFSLQLSELIYACLASYMIAPK